LEEILVEAGPHIENGTYPDPRVRDHFDDRFISTQPTLKRGVTGETGDRLLRANVIWGDDGQITSSAVLEAFALPSLADRSAQVLDEPGFRGEEPGIPTVPTQQTKRKRLPLLEQVNAWSQRPANFLEASVDKFREWLYLGVVDRLRLDQDLIHV